MGKKKEKKRPPPPGKTYCEGRKTKKRRDLICVWRDTSFAKSYILTYIPLISHPYGTPSNYVDVYDRYIATTNGGVGAFFANKKKKKKRQPHLFRVDNGERGMQLPEI